MILIANDYYINMQKKGKLYVGFRFTRTMWIFINREKVTSKKKEKKKEFFSHALCS